MVRRGIFCLLILLSVMPVFALAQTPAQRHTSGHARPAAVAEPASPPPDPMTQPCARGNDLRTSALCAQWKMADAAHDGAKGMGWLVFASILAVCLSFTAAALVALSLRDGRKTAQMLAKAFESGRAVILPQRAFVTAHIKPQMFGDPDYSLVEAGIDWRNFGERSALHVQMRHALLVQPRDVGAPLSVPAGLETGWISLAAGEVVEGRVETLPQDQMAAVARGELDLYLVSEVRFRDQLDPDRVRQEQFVMRADLTDIVPEMTSGGQTVALQLTPVEKVAAAKGATVRGVIEGWILDRKASEIHNMLSKLDATPPVAERADEVRK